MGDTGTDHHKPENITRVKAKGMYEADNGDLLKRTPHGSTTVYVPVATFATRREAAEFSATRSGK